MSARGAGSDWKERPSRFRAQRSHEPNFMQGNEPKPPGAVVPSVERYSSRLIHGQNRWTDRARALTGVTATGPVPFSGCATQTELRIRPQGPGTFDELALRGAAARAIPVSSAVHGGSRLRGGVSRRRPTTTSRGGAVGDRMTLSYSRLLAGSVTPASATLDSSGSAHEEVVSVSDVSSGHLTLRDVPGRGAPGRAMRGRKKNFAAELRDLTENKAARSSVWEMNGAGDGHGAEPAALDRARGEGARSPQASPHSYIPPRHRIPDKEGSRVEGIAGSSVLVDVVGEGEWS